MLSLTSLNKKTVVRRNQSGTKITGPNELFTNLSQVKSRTTQTRCIPTDKGLSHKVLCLIKILYASFLNIQPTLPFSRGSREIYLNMSRRSTNHTHSFSIQDSCSAISKLMLRRKGPKQSPNLGVYLQKV